MPIQDSKDKSSARQISEKSEITRRSALNTIATGAAVGAMAITSFPLSADASPPRTMNINAMTPAQWEEFVGSSFRVNGPSFDDPQYSEETAEIRLEQVIENNWVLDKDPNQPSQLPRALISLLFLTNKEIPNATFSVEHNRLGKSNLFLQEVPRGDFADKTIYEIVMN